MSLLQNTQALLDLQEQIRDLPSNEPIIVQPVLENVTITPSETEQHVTAGPDADGIDTATVRAIPSNYVGSAVQKQGSATFAPQAFEYTAIPAGRYTTGDVKVGAIPSNFVGSAIPRRDENDVSVEFGDEEVHVPAGYYPEGATAPLDMRRLDATANGYYETDGNFAYKAVNVDVRRTLQILVQPKDVTAPPSTPAPIYVVADGDGLTYQWQYQAMSSSSWTNSGAAGANTAAIAPSDSASYKYRCIIVDAYGETVTSEFATVTRIAAKSSTDLTVSGATVTAPAGYYAAAASKAVATTTPIAWNNAAHEIGHIDATALSVGNLSYGDSTRYAYLGIPYGTFLDNAKWVRTPATDLLPENIVSGKTIFGVAGTASSGGGMNVQGYHGYATVTATSYTATAVTLTVKTTGTYKVSWTGFRNTNSGTSGSQLYIGTSAYGSANTSFVSTYFQSVVLNNVSLTAGQTVTVRARARSTSYIMGVGNLIIEQTA